MVHYWQIPLEVNITHHTRWVAECWTSRDKFCGGCVYSHINSINEHNANNYPMRSKTCLTLYITCIWDMTEMIGICFTQFIIRDAKIDWKSSHKTAPFCNLPFGPNQCNDSFCRVFEISTVQLERDFQNLETTF